MSAAHEIVIVGGGLEGLSVARSLAERGVTDVMVLERSTLCSGGTAKSSGVVRAHYGAPSLVAMAWHGIRVLEDAERTLGTDVGFRQTGYVVGVGPADVDALHANAMMQRSLGVPVDLINHSEVAELWPTAYLDDFSAFAYEPRGGHGDAYLTGMAFAATARRAGAQIRQHAPVVRLTTGTDGQVTGVQLADGERVTAGLVVLAAGPWSTELAAGVGVTLPIRAQREQILLVDPGQDLGDVPVFSDLVTLQYVRAEGSGEILFGNSDHSRPEHADPDAYRNRADVAFVDTAVDKLTHRFPKLAHPRATTSYAGCYDVTPDFNPVIGAAPVDGLMLCAGFSGHGFKISPAVGRLVADLVCEGHSSDPSVDAADFRLARFSEGKPLASRHPYVGAGQMR